MHFSFVVSSFVFSFFAFVLWSLGKTPKKNLQMNNFDHRRTYMWDEGSVDKRRINSLRFLRINFSVSRLGFVDGVCVFASFFRYDLVFGSFNFSWWFLLSFIRWTMLFVRAVVAFFVVVEHSLVDLLLTIFELFGCVFWHFLRCALSVCAFFMRCVVMSMPRDTCCTYA